MNTTTKNTHHTDTVYTDRENLVLCWALAAEAARLASLVVDTDYQMSTEDYYALYTFGELLAECVALRQQLENKA